MEETKTALIKSLTESSKAKILISLFFLLLSLIIAFNFKESQTEMTPEVLKYFVPASYAGIVVFLFWFLYEAVWQQLPEQKFASRYEEIHSCLGKIQEYLRSPNPMISPISPLETQASFLVLGNMLEKRFGIAYPLYSEGEEQRSYFVICSSFLIAMLKYAETGDLKGAKEYSKAFRNS